VRVGDGNLEKLVGFKDCKFCQKTKYHPDTDTLRIHALCEFYRYQMDITRFFSDSKIPICWKVPEIWNQEIARITGKKPKNYSHPISELN